MEVTRGRGHQLEAERKVITKELEAALDDNTVDMEAYGRMIARYASTLWRLKQVRLEQAQSVATESDLLYVIQRQLDALAMPERPQEADRRVLAARARALDEERRKYSMHLQEALSQPKISMGNFVESVVCYASTLCQLKRTQDQLAGRSGR